MTARLVVVTAMLGSLAPLARAATDCPTGQEVSADTAGHCCWPEQVWSASRGVCVGIPECPDGFETRGESCVAPPACPAGQKKSEDTRGHCCWPAQVWSTARAICVGIPQCPSGMTASGERCIAVAAAPAPAPPPAPAQPAPAPSAPPVNPALPRWTPVNPSGAPSTATPTTPAPTSAYQPIVPAAPAAPPPRVPVRFVTRDHGDDHYRVTADGKSCTTPCTLELPTGELHVEADAGGRSLGAPLRVPAEPSVVAVSHRSRGHYVLGASLLAVGAADVALGFWFVFGNEFDNHEAVGGVNVALGGIAAIVGIVDLAITGRARLTLRAAESVGSAR